MKKEAKEIMTVTLSSCGNPDFPNQKATDYMSPALVQVVKDFKDASKLCRTYIDAWDLGGGNWIGGQVFLKNKQVARISYNGRVWDMDDNEIEIS